MKAALVFPPLVGASQPYSSLPALAAFVRGRGRHEVVLHDANLDFALRLLSPTALQSSADLVGERLDALHASGEHRSETEHYRRVLRASLQAPVVCDGIAEAVEDLRRTETYSDLGRLHHARRVVRDAFSIHSEATFPASLSISHLSDEHGTAAEIERRARDGSCRLLDAFYADTLLPGLARERPGAVGVSITYPSQILPAVALALAVRERLPGVPLVFGGHIASRWSASPSFVDVFRWCDFLVFGEGETALESLLTALELRLDLDGVPNLAYRCGPHAVRNPARIEDIDEMPTPDYRGLPLDRYLAPEPVFLLSTSRGCYWSSCQFCSVSPSMRGQYRRRSSARLAEDVSVLEARHGARCLMLGDDCVAPSTLTTLSRILRGKGISWECQVRFEPALTRGLLCDLERAGCRNLAFGLESYAPRVLSRMDKGVRHPEIARILDDCRSAGVAFNLQLFFGFPGETEGEAMETVRFLVEQMHGAATFSVGVFELQRGSAVASRPEAFGLQIETGHTLSVRLDYSPLPEHAVRTRELVERELAERMRFAGAPLSLDAHTLLFLHRAGVAAMAAQYYRCDRRDAAPPPPSRRGAPSPTLTLRRNRNQTVVLLPVGDSDPAPAARNASEPPPAERIVLYDYDADCTVELSPVALWVLQQLDGVRTLAEVGEDPGASHPDLASSIAGIVEALTARGLIRAVAGSTNGPSGPTGVTTAYEVPADQPASL